MEIEVLLQFHGDLNDFLPPSRRNVLFRQSAGSTDTLKHVAESLQVPHPEIGSAFVNGIAASLDATVGHQDEVHLHPPALPIHLDGKPLFVADGHVGRLASYLRMLGFDTWYEPLADDPTLAAVSHREARILLTRDVGLLKRKEVAAGYCVRSDQPRRQIEEVSGRYDLRRYFAPFTRCMECNGLSSRFEG
jgi:uncharacterized protein